MTWPRYDVIVSSDSRCISLKETFLDDVKKMMVMWLTEILESLGREAWVFVDDRRIVARADKGSVKGEKQVKNGRKGFAWVN